MISQEGGITLTPSKGQVSQQQGRHPPKGLILGSPGGKTRFSGWKRQGKNGVNGIGIEHPSFV